MRILHIDTEMTWRGGENQLRLLLEGLQKTEADSHVAVRPGSAAAERLARIAKVHTLSMRGGFDLRAAWRLAKLCRAYQIDLIDAHTSNAHSLALLAKLLYPGVKLVVHRRVDYVPKSDVVNRKKYLSPKVDRYVAISRAIADVLTAYGVPRSRIGVARSAIDTTAYARYDRRKEKATLAQTYGLSDALVFIGNASAMTEQKGYDVLLRACAKLKRDGVMFHCFIAGDGHLRDRLETLRIELGLEYDVTFLGFIEDVPRFLASLDVLAVSSNYEGLGTIILDGIGAGLAVAGTQVGGIPEIVLHDETGLLSPVGDAEAFAANLRLMIESASLRERLAATARLHIAREFSLAAMVGGNLDIYRELLAKPR